MAENNGLGELRKLLDKGGLAELGPGPRSGILTEAAIHDALKSFFAEIKWPAERQALTRGLLLLWNDHAEAAHVIAQEIENPDGSFVHGIVHRREPDYGNAAYWFRRVGAHECYPEIASRVRNLLDAKNQTALKKQLLGEGKWDPFAFIHMCEKVSVNSSDKSVIESLQQIQLIETEVLLEHFLS